MKSTKRIVIAMFLAHSAASYAQEQEEVLVIGEQDPYFEKSRSTALKFDADDLTTPFSTSVINSTILEDLKANQLEDAYGYITGVSRSGTSANSMTIRGQTADLRNIQVDGMPGLASRFGSPVTANVDRVEVLKGPASVLYGWMDPSGLINIVTKKPEAERATSIDVTAQQFTDQGASGIEASVDTTGSLNSNGTVLYRLVAGFEDTESFRDHVASDSLYVFPSFSIVPDDASRLDIQLEFAEENRNADNGLWVIDADGDGYGDIETIQPIETYYQEPGNYDKDRGYGLSISYVRDINEQLKTTIKWRSLWHEDERDLYESNTIVDVDGESFLRRRNRHQFNERNYHHLDANLAYSFGGKIGHELLVGVNGGHEERQFDRLAYDDRSAEGYINLIDPIYTGDVLSDDPNNFRHWDLDTLGAYVMDRISFNENWVLLLGARWDSQAGDYELRFIDVEDSDFDASESISNVSFNGGLVYTVNDNVSVYASWAESFFPQAIPSYGENGDQLEPEQGEQWEAGFKYQALSGKLNLNLAYFDITQKNLAEEGPSGFDELIGEISTEGVEVNVQLQPNPNLQLQMGYTYMNGEVTGAFENADLSLGNSPGFTPKNSAFLLSRYNYPKSVLGGLVGASIGLKYQDQRYTDERVDRRVLLPAHELLDVAMYYEVNNIKYALNISNVFNELYYDGGTNDTRIYPGEPRKVSLSARFDF